LIRAVLELAVEDMGTICSLRSKPYFGPFPLSAVTFINSVWRLSGRKVRTFT
jgi:hypothetical protein